MKKQTFKIFEDDSEEFNVVKATQKNIEEICGVLVRCNFLSAEETVYYAEIAGFEPDEKDGKKVFEFTKDLTKKSYVDPLINKLFIEKPEYKDTIDKAEVQKALDFFFNSFGEHTHIAIRLLNYLQALRSLPRLMNTLTQLKDLKPTS